MNVVEITGDCSVSAQIDVSDVQEIADLGFKSIMCNRPDNEGPGQPLSDDIADVARELGLEWSYVPVISGQITQANVEEFRSEMARLPKPVLAYCRSGARCQNIWHLAQD